MDTCPLTGRKLRASLDVFHQGVLLFSLAAKEAIDGIAQGLYKPTGSKRKVCALILLKRPNDEFPGPIPRPKPTSHREHVGDSYVWQHSRNAQLWHAEA